MTVNEYLKQIDNVISNGKYKDNWQSLANHKTPDWYYKDKLKAFREEKERREIEKLNRLAAEQEACANE